MSILARFMYNVDLGSVSASSLQLGNRDQWKNNGSAGLNGNAIDSVCFIYRMQANDVFLKQNWHVWLYFFLQIYIKVMIFLVFILEASNVLS